MKNTENELNDEILTSRRGFVGAAATGILGALAPIALAQQSSAQTSSQQTPGRTNSLRFMLHSLPPN